MALPTGMPPTLDDTLGAMLIGAFISTMLVPGEMVHLLLHVLTRYSLQPLRPHSQPDFAVL